MKYIGYSNNAHIIEHKNKVVEVMTKLKCSVIHMEDYDGMARNEWRLFIDELEEGDVAVLYSFYDAFDSHHDMMFFLKLCAMKKIRFISIKDKLDSSNEYFQSSGVRQVLEAINTVSAKKSDGKSDDFEAELYALTHEQRKLKRYRMVINMYKAGYPIKEIMYRTGYKGKSNIYRILHLYNIDVEFPSMLRNSTEAVAGVI